MSVLIADHESSERASLVEQCYSQGGLGNLIVVESGIEALEHIRVNRPDVALLACELKDMTGFAVLRALDEQECPATILVAHDNRHAAEARSSVAVDYLTCPISADRLALALRRAYSGTRRAVRRVAAKTAPVTERADVRYANSLPLGRGDRLVGERAGRMYFFSPLDIDYIEADSN
jgi:DNA-binding NtrC family response regulator